MDGKRSRRSSNDTVELGQVVLHLGTGASSLSEKEYPFSAQAAGHTYS
jgi:hypothetical protein